MNTVIISGRFGQTPEVKDITGEGKYVTNFSVATTEFYKGEKHTEWHACTAWGPKAEFAGKYFTKGDGVTLSGKLTTRSWETEDGKKRYKTEILVNNFEFPPSSGNNKESIEDAGDEIFGSENLPA